MRIIFILPGRGGGGGAHSVVQEAVGLVRMGVDVAIAASRDLATEFRMTYPELAQFRIDNPLFGDAEELATAIKGYDLAIATTAPSAILLSEILAKPWEGAPRAGYYIQDYEPLFFAPGSKEWASACASYNALPGALLFAKTDWLCSIVDSNHNVSVVRVEPSIDHSTYYPDLSIRGDKIRVAAMIRPKTPRRAPQRTVRILERLAIELEGQVTLTAFGCDAAELGLSGLRMSDRIAQRGVLTRAQVSNMLRSTDIFLDLSDFQAFGRTGLEGMACGCVPVLPVFGGATEYARHRENAFLVDTRSDDQILGAVRELAANKPAMIQSMRMEAVKTALGYSIGRAAFSEYQAFAGYLGR